MAPLSPADIERFWAHVDTRGRAECWEWTAGRYPKGYGSFRSRGRMHHAQRIAYEIATGTDPGTLCVLHRCDNPPCCNPAHLFLGTYGDNARDRHAKGRSANVFEHGERHPMSKLSPNQVLRIRELVSRGVTQTEVAEQFGISQSGVSLIVRRSRWSHL